MRREHNTRTKGNKMTTATAVPTPATEDTLQAATPSAAAAETTQGQRAIVTQMSHARRVSTPLIALTTADSQATVATICRDVPCDELHPRCTWDIVRGFVAKNEAGKAWLGTIGDAAATTNPVTALTVAADAPAGTMLLFQNAQRYVDDLQIIQALQNLRDEYKRNRRTVVLMGPQISLPIELQADVISFDEPLPGDEELRGIVRKQLTNAAQKITFTPTDALIEQAAGALKGANAYGAEQLAAMSFRRSGIDFNYLRTQASKLIEQTKGLIIEKGGETFADIGGQHFAKEYGTRLFSGPRRPRLVVRIEELEKALAGAKGDMSGTSGDALQVILSEMEDNGWSGMLAYGAPGAGKSLYSKALANTFEALPMRFDVNATKGSLVGSSEANIRAAMKVIKTIGGSDVFFVASVNKLENLPPELQRRFRSGVWYFDIPDAAERAGIWKINRRKFDIADSDRIGDDTDFTGADIRNVCEQAYACGCSLKEALRYVVPLRTQSPHAITEARNTAKGRFISAAHGGVYELPTAAGEGDENRTYDMAD